MDKDRPISLRSPRLALAGLVVPMLLILATILRLPSAVAQIKMLTACPLTYVSDTIGAPNNQSITVRSNNGAGDGVAYENIDLNWAPTNKKLRSFTISTSSGSSNADVNARPPVTVTLGGTVPAGDTATLILEYDANAKDITGPIDVAFHTSDYGVCGFSFTPGAAANNPPTANNDSANTNEDTPLNVGAPGVLGNDTDPEGDPLSAILVSSPSNGSLTLNSNGSFTYTPNTNFNGSDSFTYTANDGTSDSNVATVTIAVNPVNDPPSAVNDAVTTNEDTAVLIDVLANDSDPEGGLDPASLMVTVPPSHGSTTMGSGQITYTPATNYNGSDSFVYQVCDATDCASATVSVTVNSVNDAPVAANDSTSTPVNTPVNIDVLLNDSDVDGTLVASTLKVTSGPSHGTATVGSGKIAYTPSTGYSGSDSLTYEVCDNEGACDSATVSITVTGGTNSPPIAHNDTGWTNEDETIWVDVLFNDEDPDDPSTPPLDDRWTIEVVTQPSHGAATPDGMDIRYIPQANYNGSDSFVYKVRDPAGAWSNLATVTMTIYAVDDPPVANNDSANTPVNTAKIIDVLANDSDAENNLNRASLAIASPPSHGTATVGSEKITYTPETDYTGSDSFHYQVCDTTAPTPLCATATVTVSVGSVNNPPVANNDAVSVPKNTTVRIDVLANDSDPDGNLDVGTLAVTGGPSFGTASADTAIGKITYTPPTNYTGSDSFTYRVCDMAGACDEAVVAITVVASSTPPSSPSPTATPGPGGSQPANTPPAARDDMVITLQDTPVEINVLTNDSDPDGSLNPASVTVMSGPGHGATAVDATNGQITYTPAPGYVGSDTFTYQVCDNGGACSIGLVTVAISPSRRPATTRPPGSTPGSTAGTGPSEETEVAEATQPALEVVNIDGLLLVGQIADVDQAGLYDTVRFFIAVRNIGESTLENVSLNNQLSSEGMIIGGALSRGLIAVAPNNAQWFIESIEPGQTVTFTLLVRVIDGQNGRNLTSCGTASASGVEPAITCDVVAILSRAQTVPAEQAPVELITDLLSGDEISGQAAPQQPSQAEPGSLQWQRDIAMCLRAGNSIFGCVPATRLLLILGGVVLSGWFIGLVVWYRRQEKREQPTGTEPVDPDETPS